MKAASVSHRLIYDHSFEGFLTAIFHCYEQKIRCPEIIKDENTPSLLFGDAETIITDTKKAERVWKSFREKTSSSQKFNFFKAFLSEIKGVENLLFEYVKYVFSGRSEKSSDYGNSAMLRISQIAKMVGREKHRMEAFIRFKLTKDQIYFATIEPDFNVLPLILKHFKDRYADQKWAIYDIKRSYGIYYDLNEVSTVELDFLSKLITEIPKDALAEEEIEFQKLWKAYYQNVNIKARKNKKLHLQHVPKRYWKYLIEKNNQL